MTKPGGRESSLTPAGRLGPPLGLRRAWEQVAPGCEPAGQRVGLGGSR